MALRSRGRAVGASVAALAGAVTGGVGTYLWGRRVPAEDSAEALRRIPAISREMVDRCVAEVDARGNAAMLLGPLRGVPYKLYARAAGLRGLPLPRFVAWSVPARIPRFVIVAYLTAWLRERAEGRLGPEVTQRLQGPVHAAFWVAFYAWYLNAVGREGDIPG